MNRYISDMHLGHANVLRFDHRPFADVEEMERYMMNKWQDTVQKDDDVWILGDFAYHDKKNPVEYLRQLPGHKHLIIGNHDEALLKNAAAMRYFESVDMLTKIVDTLDGEKRQVILCHYPIYEWDGYHRGTLHVYGHVHNSSGHTKEDETQLPDIPHLFAARGNAFNAGCMINGYAPVTLRELRENNQRFLEYLDQ